jgi:two-component system sensor histidine kinase CpxA
MRSVYAKVLLWCFGTILVSLIAFGFISTFVFSHLEGRGNMSARTEALFRQAVTEYEMGGAAQLQSFARTVHEITPAQLYLLDPSGKDLVGGEDRSGLLSAVKSKWGVPAKSGDRMIVAQASPDGRYRLIAVLDPPPSMQRLIPYYLMVLAAVGLLCWALAANIASPLRNLARVVERFGRGDLDARANLNRHDEIGELARSFDQMAERIRTLLSAERRLLQDVSHELRTPLARMSFAAELIRTAGDREAAIARLKKEIQKLSALVGALLQVTRIEGDPDSVDWKSVSLTELLAEIVQDSQVEADARGCRMVFSPNGEVMKVGDRDLLQRAVENVVLNAIRHTPGGSAVEVAISRNDADVRIRVRDHGSGVPDAALKKIFQPFYRVDDARDGATGGMGLGLAIAQRAISVHHGRIWAENANPGLAVTIELPVG